MYQIKTLFKYTKSQRSFLELYKSGENYLQVFPWIELEENEGSTLIRSRRKEDVLTGQI